MVRTAIAAWRGSRSRTSSKAEHGIIVRPQLDGRIQMVEELIKPMDGLDDLAETRRSVPAPLRNTGALPNKKARRSSDYGSDLEDGLSPVVKVSVVPYLLG